MVTDVSQISVLTGFRQQKAKLGSIALTLFLAGWLNLLVQPCLMAAPIQDCYGPMVFQQSMLASGSVAIDHDYLEIELVPSADCQSMEGCGNLDSSYPVSSSFDRDKHFLASVGSSAPIQPGPVPFSRPLTGPKTCFSRVPLFIQNCAFLI